MAENITVDPKDAEDNKVMAILAYLGFPLVLVPIFAAKESPFARFHSNQGILLCLAAIAYYLAVFLIVFLLALISPTFAGIIAIVLYLGMFIFPVLVIIGIINAVKGVAKELPVIGKLFTIIK